jgi:hypothetical protein
MIVGDSSDWDDVFPENLLPLIFNHIFLAWERMLPTGCSDLEDAITDKLYIYLVNSKSRNDHPFRINRETPEFDMQTAKEIGRMDIVFYPPNTNDENIYLCIEAKRLNAIISGVVHSLADQYVKEGMQRFVDRKYASHVSHGAMLGYVLDGKISSAMKNVENNIRKHFTKLQMEHDCGFLPSTIRPDDHHTKETRHKRSTKPESFSIHHLFVTGDKN